MTPASDRNETCPTTQRFAVFRDPENPPDSWRSWSAYTRDFNTAWPSFVGFYEGHGTTRRERMADAIKRARIDAKAKHDAAPTPAPREDICKGCSTYAWCSVTGACLAESNPHDKGDRDRVVSTLSTLDPSPPSSPPTVAVPRDVYEAMRDEMDGLFDLFVDVLAQGTARADSDHKTGACVITYDDGCISSYEDAFAYLGLTETPEKRWFTSDEFYAAVKAKRAALRGTTTTRREPPMPDLDLDMIARRVEAVRQYGVNARFVDPQPIRLPISSMYAPAPKPYIAAERICLTDAPALIAAARERDGLRALLREARDLISRRMVAVGVNREQQAMQRTEARIVIDRIDAALENNRG